MIVSNAVQWAPFSLFSLVGVMGKSESELSSKKNTGTFNNINVAEKQLAILIRFKRVVDISGMDAVSSFLFQIKSRKSYFSH